MEEKKHAPFVEKRMAKLRVYMEAHIAPLVAHCEEGLLDPSEAVYILLAETVMLIGTRLPGASKFPAYQDLASRLNDERNLVVESLNDGLPPDWEAPGE
jgi:hypothetical protein